MKALTTFTITCCIGLSTLCQAQTEENPTRDTVIQTNLLDEQTKMYGQIFELAGAGENNPVGNAKNYSELIENSDVPEDQKEKLRDQYQVYDLSLDPSKKDSLKMAVERMLENAIEKSQTEIDRQ